MRCGVVIDDEHGGVTGSGGAVRAGGGTGSIDDEHGRGGIAI
jgi:hypothetical protein